MPLYPSVENGPKHFAAPVSFGSTVTLPEGQVTDDNIEPDAKINASKVVHQFPVSYRQAPGSAVVADTVDLLITRGLGQLLQLTAAINGAIATGADRTVTIDLLKSTGAGAFASVLSGGGIVLDDDSVLRTAEAATFSDDDHIAGDLYRLTVAVAGAAGAQGEGLIVTLWKTEESTP